MRPLTVALALSALLAGSSALLADTIPYPNVGTVAPTTELVATTTGDIMGYFYNYSAGDLDSVRLVDLTSGYTSPYYFQNYYTADGAEQNFGSVNAGDVLVFELNNAYVPGVFASDPSLSTDGINHAYITSFSGGIDNGVTIPSGIYVGMEDLPAGATDLDYNDDNFVFTNVTAVPEPGSLTLLGTGILGVAGMLRRRMFSR